MNYKLQFNLIGENGNEEAVKSFLYHYYLGGFIMPDHLSIQKGDYVNGILPEWRNGNKVPTDEVFASFQYLIKSRWIVESRILEPVDGLFYLVLARASGNVEDL